MLHDFDVQSDLVLTATRWCVPLALVTPGAPVISGAQTLLELDAQLWLVDTPNVLAVPAALLRRKLGRLSSDQQLGVEAALDFMLRGY